MRALLSVIGLALTVVAAAAIGFGVPLGWLWIGSQLQADNGASSVSFSVAMVVLFGIIASYVGLLYLAGVAMSFVGGGSERKATSSSPWMRGMTDTRQRSAQDSLGGIERIFVVTTVIVTAAFWLWFAFKSGSPLPNQ